MKLLRTLILRPLRRDPIRTALTILSGKLDTVSGDQALSLLRDAATHSAEAAAIADVRVSVRDGRIQSIERR